MASFVGKYDGKLDDRGRVPLPAAYRKRFDEGDKEQIVCRFDANSNSLKLYTISVWEKECEKIYEKFDEYNKEDNIILQQYFAETTYLDIDSVGRILLNKNLKELIKIDNEVLFMGDGKYIHIRNKADYEANKLSLQELDNIVNARLRKS